MQTAKKEARRKNHTILFDALLPFSVIRSTASSAYLTLFLFSRNEPSCILHQNILTSSTLITTTPNELFFMFNSRQQ